MYGLYQCPTSPDAPDPHWPSLMYPQCSAPIRAQALSNKFEYFPSVLVTNGTALFIPPNVCLITERHFPNVHPTPLKDLN